MRFCIRTLTALHWLSCCPAQPCIAIDDGLDCVCLGLHREFTFHSMAVGLIGPACPVLCVGAG